MQPKSGSDQNTIRVERGKYSATFKSTPLPSLGLVASLTASGFCFLKAGFCLKEAPSPCEGFSAQMESQQAEPWQARGGQHIPLAHSQAHFRTAIEENSTLGEGFLVWHRAQILRWELQGPRPFWRLVLLTFKMCWCVVHPSTSSAILKALSCLCPAVLSFVLLFHAMSTPALHPILSTQKRTVPMCRACKTHYCTFWVEVLPQMFLTGAVRCEQVWRQTAAQLGFVGCPKSRSLVFFLNGRVCPAWGSCNVFYDLGDAPLKHCIQKTQVFSGLCILMVMQPSHVLLVTWQWYHRAYRAIHSWPPLSTVKEFPKHEKFLSPWDIGSSGKHLREGMQTSASHEIKWPGSLLW